MTLPLFKGRLLKGVFYFTFPACLPFTALEKSYSFLIGKKFPEPCYVPDLQMIPGWQ
jgi:hypothetical protein